MISKRIDSAIDEVNKINLFLILILFLIVLLFMSSRSYLSMVIVRISNPNIITD